MKNIILILCWLLTSKAYTQNLQEWTRQKKTQIKYLVGQIAALQVYTSYARKGINIAKQGLHTINDFKFGEFSLQREYFSSFKNINPNIKAYWKIADIIYIEKQIANLCFKQMNTIHKSSQLTGNEAHYCNAVFTNLLKNCFKIRGQLKEILQPLLITLTDNERLRRIDDLYNNIKDQNEFQQHFWNSVHQLVIQRFIERNDIKTGSSMFNLN